MQTDMRYLVKGFSSLMSSGIVGSLSRFVVSLALANWLTQEAFGTYTYILTTIELCAIFVLSGVNTALSQSVAKGFEGSMPTALKTVVKWGSIGSLMALIIGGYYFLQGNLLLGKAFIALAFFIPFYKSLGMFSNFLNGKKLFGTCGKYESLFHITTALTFITVIYFTKNLLIILIAFFLTKTAMNGILFWYTQKKHKSNTKIDPNMISYGKHLSFIRIFASGASRADKLILWHALGPVQVAIYTIAMAPLSLLQLPIQKIAMVAFPKLVEKNQEQLQKTLPLKILKTGGIMAIIVLIYIVLAPYFFTLFYPQYSTSIIYAQVIALAGILSVKKILITALEARKEKRKLYFGKALETTSNILGYAILGFMFGIWGIIAATLLTEVITTITYYRLFMLKKKIRFLGYSM